MPDRDEKTQMYIDGNQLHSTAKKMNLAIDWARFKIYFATHYNIQRVNYYSLIWEDVERNVDEDDYMPMRKILDWLSYNGFNVIEKFTKHTRGDNGPQITGSMAVDIAVDMVAAAKFTDHYILYTLSTDHRKVVEHLRRLGRKTTLLGTLQHSNVYKPDILRRQVDDFIELESLRSHIERHDDAKRRES